MKYAIVPINIKQINHDLFLRCVLIQFKNKNGNFYEGTRLLDCSPYFKDSSKALQYKFEKLCTDENSCKKEMYS